jgi:saccharopine dehydrogenase-like NADP-dependent oxidoreductase
MARTTAYTASIVAALILKGDVHLKGVAPPEMLGMEDRIYKRIMDELNSRGVKIAEEICSE